MHIAAAAAAIAPSKIHQKVDIEPVFFGQTFANGKANANTKNSIPSRMHF